MERRKGAAEMLVQTLNYDTSFLMRRLPKEKDESPRDSVDVERCVTTRSSIGVRFWSQGRVENLFVQGLTGWDLATTDQ